VGQTLFVDSFAGDRLFSQPLFATCERADLFYALWPFKHFFSVPFARNLSAFFSPDFSSLLETKIEVRPSLFFFSSNGVFCFPDRRENLLFSDPAA